VPRPPFDALLRSLLCLVIAAGVSCARTAPPPAPAASPAPTAASAPPAASVPAVASAPASQGCLPSRDGYLRVRVRGARDLDIDWPDAQLQCDGGARPAQRGLRVTFLGHLREHAEPLRFVFGFAVAEPGKNRGSSTAHNLPANVTLIFEGHETLYSTSGDGRCTIDALTLGPRIASGRATLRRASARGFCTGVATRVGGSEGLLVSRFDFAGPVFDEDLTDDTLHASTP